MEDFARVGGYRANGGDAICVESGYHSDAAASNARSVEAGYTPCVFPPIMKPTLKWMPVINEDKCSGCGLCVNACGPACLGMDSGLAVLILPEVCGSEEHCIGVCADDAIQMAWLPWTGNTS